MASTESLDRRIDVYAHDAIVVRLPARQLNSSKCVRPNPTVGL